MRSASKLSIHIIFFLVLPTIYTYGQEKKSSDNKTTIVDLPFVLRREHPDYLALQLNHEASVLLSLYQLPGAITLFPSLIHTIKNN